MKSILSNTFLLLVLLVSSFIAASCNGNKDSEATPEEKTYEFAKIGEDGTQLDIQDQSYSDTGSEASGTKWSCIKNKNLMWEVKSNEDNTAEKKNNKFFWHEPSSLSSNDGSDKTSCSVPGNICTTKRYADYLNNYNSQGLCGKKNWRLPTSEELLGISVLGSIPTINNGYFPNTESSAYFTSNTSNENEDKAIVILFSQDAQEAELTKADAEASVRLVASD